MVDILCEIYFVFLYVETVQLIKAKDVWEFTKIHQYTVWILLFAFTESIIQNLYENKLFQQILLLGSSTSSLTVSTSLWLQQLQQHTQLHAHHKLCLHFNTLVLVWQKKL